MQRRRLHILRAENKKMREKLYGESSTPRASAEGEGEGEFLKDEMKRVATKLGEATQVRVTFRAD